MPALDNPRWERFAQAIVEGLANGDRKPYSQGRAYIAAGYTAKDQGKRGGSAECAASRLLNRVKPILERVRELQAIAARNAAETAEKMARELNEIQYEARADKAHAAAVAAVLGKAKILNIGVEQQHKPQDFNTAQSMQDIGRKLLQSIGFALPDDVSIQAAIEANDAFIARLEAIRDGAKGLTTDQWTHNIEAATPAMIEAAINGALPRGIKLNGNALAIAQFKTPSSPLSDPRPTIELMRSININGLRRVIPRYSNTINEPNVSLKYPDIARLRLSPSCLEITHYFRARTMLPYRMGYDLFRPTSC